MTTSRFEAAALELIARMKVSAGAVTVRQTMGADGQIKIVADCEAGIYPQEIPDTIDGFAIEYRQRRTLKISD